MRANARWRDTIRSTTQAKQFCSGPLTQLAGWDPHFIYPDVLHVMYLGCVRDFLSSIIVLLAVYGSFWGGGDIETRLELGCLDWLNYCTRIGYNSACVSFARKRFGWTSKLKLPQLKAKGKDIQEMVFWLAEVCDGWASEMHECADLAATACHWLAEFVRALAAGSLLLTEAAVTLAHQAGSRWLLASASLREWAHGRGLGLFAFRPKPANKFSDGCCVLFLLCCTWFLSIV